MVSSVYDGDTFTSKGIRYRLFGIDAPEIKDKNGNFTKNNKHLFALKARNFLKENILKKEIEIIEISKDKYNRKVAKISYKNKDFSKELLRNGLAIIRYISLDVKSPFYTKDKEYYKKLLNEVYYAKKWKKGFWKIYNSELEVEKNLY